MSEETRNPTFRGGDKVTRSHWLPNEWVEIVQVRGERWVGFDQAGAPWSEDCSSGWRLWVEPLVRRQWIIETERRRAEVGARYCVWHAEDATTIGPILKGDLIHGAVRDVIVSVCPVDGFAGEETK